MSWAQPQRFVTLTQAPEDWQALRKKVGKLGLGLRRDGVAWEMAWTVEVGSQTGMRHIHGLEHGDYVPQNELQERWGAIVDIRAIRGARGAAKYAMKEALQVSGYAMKEATGNLDEHLDRNGGRGCHLSRGYLRGETTDSVLELLQRQRVDGEELTWVLVREGAVVTGEGSLLRVLEIPPEMALS